MQPDHSDLELRISKRSGQIYEIAIYNENQQAAETVEIPFEGPEFSAYINAVTSARRGLGYGNSDDDTASVPKNPRQLASEFGKKLFKTIFRDEVLAMYREQCKDAQEEKRRLRLRLRLNDPELAALPWEFVFDEHGGGHVSLHSKRVVSRYVEDREQPKSLLIPPPLRILGVISSPADLPQLNVAVEQAKIRDALSHHLDNNSIELTWLENPTVDELREAFSSESRHVLHFIGHGGFDRESGKGFLALCNKQGDCDRLPAEHLALMIRESEAVRLVVLNCCEGAKADESDLYSSTGAVLAKENVPAVVSMQYEITDEAAIKFSEKLYDSIANGVPIDAALQEARIAIYFSSVGSLEWATPVLHMRSRDGQLFKISLRNALFKEPQNRQNQWSDNIIAAASPLNAIEQRARSVFLSRVCSFVDQDAVGQKSSAGTGSGTTGLVPVKMEIMNDAVEQISEKDSTEYGLSKFFYLSGASLLLLGDPGSGKSTMLARLALQLAERAQSDPRIAMPAVISLSSWAGEPMLAWLVEQTSVRYKIPRKDVQSWLDSHQMILLLDGLDEVSAVHRAACVDAINDVAPEVGLSGIAVTCRTGDYLALPNRVSLTVGVRLMSLEDDAVLQHLDELGDEFSGLKRLLEVDASMQILARTPLMLGLMIEVYRSVRPEEIVSTNFANASTRRDKLMGNYVDRMFARVKAER